MGDSRYSKRIFKRVLRYLIWESISDWIISSSSSSGGLLRLCSPKGLWRYRWHWHLTPTMMCLMSDYDIKTLQTQRLTGLELTHSPTPCEFDDNNHGLSLLDWRIEAVFSFLCQSSSQDHLLGHTPYSPSSWIHLTRNKRIEEVWSRFLSLHKSLVWTRFSEKDEFLAFVS